MDRSVIVAAIQRTAAANGGKPLGRGRFARETGIQPADWLGRYWARWGDALNEAGLESNQFQKRLDEVDVLTALIPEIRRLGRMPTDAEIQLRRLQGGDGFPSRGVFARLGNKAELRNRILDYCQDRPECSDIVNLLQTRMDSHLARPLDESDGRDDSSDFGFVYLLKSGRYFKIGRTNSSGRRERELTIQLPERAEQVHVIETDDPIGIERYWHQRFAAHRKNGEWFDLAAAEVRAFKRRKFM